MSYNIQKAINGQEVLLEVESDDAPEVASHLFSTFPIKDIAITDPPLESIIESIYQKSEVRSQKSGVRSQEVRS